MPTHSKTAAVIICGPTLKEDSTTPGISDSDSKKTISISKKWATWTKELKWFGENLLINKYFFR